MEKENIRKEFRFNTRMLNDQTLAELKKRNIYNELVKNLSDSDIEVMFSLGIYLNTISSPIEIIKYKGDSTDLLKIVNVDLSALVGFTDSEIVALILNQFGRAIGIWYKGEELDNEADKYVISKSYQDFLISALKKFNKLWPEKYNHIIINNRIQKINNLIQQ